MRADAIAHFYREQTQRNHIQHSTWDAIPATCGVLHFLWVILMFAAFPRAPWWVLIPMGLIYSICITWNINSICHNFVHNPFFKSELLNRIFSFMQSLALGFSQVGYGSGASGRD